MAGAPGSNESVLSEPIGIFLHRGCVDRSRRVSHARFTERVPKIPPTEADRSASGGDHGESRFRRKNSQPSTRRCLRQRRSGQSAPTTSTRWSLAFSSLETPRSEGGSRRARVCRRMQWASFTAWRLARTSRNTSTTGSRLPLTPCMSLLVRIWFIQRRCGS
jgi:hypothetical protein